MDTVRGNGQLPTSVHFGGGGGSSLKLHANLQLQLDNDPICGFWTVHHYSRSVPLYYMTHFQMKTSSSGLSSACLLVKGDHTWQALHTKWCP